MRRVVFHAEAFEQFVAWARQDPKRFERITRLITEAARDRFRESEIPSRCDIS